MHVKFFLDIKYITTVKWMKRIYILLWSDHDEEGVLPL